MTTKAEKMAAKREALAKSGDTDAQALAAAPAEAAPEATQLELRLDELERTVTDRVDRLEHRVEALVRELGGGSPQTQTAPPATAEGPL